VIRCDAIVPTMHEAVRRIPAGSPCGWFLSGPSKTADIEQSLVIGAQGARALTVVLEPS
jgi:L-lactate dehydrogenase complex protein LldG